MGMNQNQVDELLTIYEGMTREELIANAMLAARAMHEAEELIEELRSDQALANAAISSYPQSLDVYSELLHREAYHQPHNTATQ